MTASNGSHKPFDVTHMTCDLTLRTLATLARSSPFLGPRASSCGSAEKGWKEGGGGDGDAIPMGGQRRGVACALFRAVGAADWTLGLGQ